MPDDDLEHPLYDHHTHHGTEHNITHTHDNHPRHHHDANGSVLYITLGCLNDGGATSDDITAAIVRHSDPIGPGGNDIDSRTTPPGSDAP